MGSVQQRTVRTENQNRGGAAPSGRGDAHLSGSGEAGGFCQGTVDSVHTGERWTQTKAGGSKRGVWRC